MCSINPKMHRMLLLVWLSLSYRYLVGMEELQLPANVKENNGKQSIRARFDLAKKLMEGKDDSPDYQSAIGLFDQIIKEEVEPLADKALQVRAHVELAKIYYFGYGLISRDKAKMILHFYEAKKYSKCFGPFTLGEPTEIKQIREILWTLWDEAHEEDDLYDVDKYKETDLHRVAFRGHKDLVMLLLEKGADVNALNENHETALHHAAAQGHLGVVELLLVKGAELHIVNKDGRMAHHNAAASGYTEVLELLCSRGADVHEKDLNGLTASDLLRIYNEKRVIDF